MVYQMTSGQAIIGPCGIVDINHLAIWNILDRYKIAKPIRTFEKIVAAGRQVLNSEAERVEDEKAQQED